MYRTNRLGKDSIIAGDEISDEFPFGWGSREEGLMVVVYDVEYGYVYTL